MNCLRNSKGQTVLESTFVITVMFLIFFAMLAFGVYLYNRTVVIFAANYALDEGLGKAPDVKTTKELQNLMQGKGYQGLSFALLVKQPSVQCIVQPPNTPDGKGTGKLWAKVRLEFYSSFPFVSGLIPNSIYYEISSSYFFTGKLP